MRLALLALAAVAAVLTLLIGTRRGRRGRKTVTLVLVLAVAWIVSLAAIRTDYRDADGFVDCWPGCSLLQDAVGAAVFGLPVLAILVAAVSVATGGLRRSSGG